MSKLQKFLKIEKELEQKFEAKRESEVVLDKEDFKGAELTAEGYFKLKQQCDYIDYKEDIEIKIPLADGEGFREQLEHKASGELKRIKKDKRRGLLVALILLAVGAFWYGLRYIAQLQSVEILSEITLVATWVFIWAAVDKCFFGRRKLTDKRMSLLHILSAKITGYGE